MEFFFTIRAAVLAALLALVSFVVEHPFLSLAIAVALIVIWLARDPLWNAITSISRIAIVVGAGILFVAALIVTAEVLVRKAIPLGIDLLQATAALLGSNVAVGAEAARIWVRDNMTFTGSDEISSYMFAVGTSWSMAHVLITRGHVRIDALYSGLRPSVRAVLDIISLILLAVFVGALLERAYSLAELNYIETNRSNTNLRIPLAWAQIPWTAGIAMFFLANLVAIMKAFSALCKGDWATVNAVGGASSQDEEIESELKGLGIAVSHGEKK